MPSYETIPTLEEPRTFTAIDTGSKRWSVVKCAGLLVLFGASAAIIFVVVLFMGDDNDKSTTNTTADLSLIAMEGVTHTRSCTFDECYASNCKQDSDPYTCLFHNGGPHGGCSATPWLTDTCDDQCDLSGCNDLDIPKDTESCDNTACTKEFCRNGQLCGRSVPYQCTSGASMYGCSSDEMLWTIRTSKTACGSCCNVKSCDE